MWMEPMHQLQQQPQKRLPATRQTQAVKQMASCGLSTCSRKVHMPSSQASDGQGPSHGRSHHTLSWQLAAMIDQEHRASTAQEQPLRPLSSSGPNLQGNDGGGAAQVGGRGVGERSETGPSDYSHVMAAAYRRNSAAMPQIYPPPPRGTTTAQPSAPKQALALFIIVLSARWSSKVIYGDLTCASEAINFLLLLVFRLTSHPRMRRRRQSEAG